MAEVNGLRSVIGKYNDRIAILFVAPWLGHDRAVELYLAFVSGLYGVILLIFPATAFESNELLDIAWLGYGQALAAPLLVKSFLTGTGLIMNISGVKFSRILRFFGAFIGSVIWIFLSSKAILLDDVGEIGFPFCVVSALFSVRIMGLALANLPRPGAPGFI